MGKKNQRKRRAVWTMRPARFLVLLEKLGFTQRGAGRFLGVTDRTIRSMIAGDASISPSTAMLLELLLERKIAPEHALKLIGVDLEEAEVETVVELGPEAEPRYF